MEHYENIELRSPDVQEILGTPPRWLWRWGTVVVFICFVILVVFSYILKYPDIIQAPVILTTKNPPQSLTARVEGRVAQYLVKDGDKVKAGQLLAIIQNPANLKDVYRLDSLVKEMQQQKSEDLLTYTLPPKLMLGELQGDYTLFVKSFEDLSYQKTENLSSADILLQSERISNLERSLNDLNAQLATENTNLINARKIYNNARLLRNAKAISQNEFTRTEEEVGNVQNRISELNNRIKERKSEIQSVRGNIVQIQKEKSVTTSAQSVALLSSINQMKTSIDGWMERYLIKAPINGTVSFQTFGRENKYYKEGDEVMAIAPLESDAKAIIGKVLLPVQGSGKVKLNQDANIKFESFPYHEFGMVRGKVAYRASLPNKEGQIYVELLLTKGMKTTYNKALDFQQEMVGQAEIITDDRRLIERILDKLLAAFKK